MNDIYLQTYLDMFISKQYLQDNIEDINTIIYCYLIIRLILIFNLY